MKNDIKYKYLEAFTIIYDKNINKIIADDKIIIIKLIIYFFLNPIFFTILM